jgi:hypothetical protein
VPSCAECNAIKGNYDPSEKGNDGQIVITASITEEIRERLISNAHDYIERWRISCDWRNEFKTAKPLFDEAVALYRKYKESPPPA